MHELGLAQSALEIALAHAAAAGPATIVSMTVRIGLVSGVDPEAFRFAFTTLIPKTPAANADLLIESVPVKAHCATCDADFDADPDFICCCPSCGRLSGDLRHGRELELARIELATSASEQ